MWWKRGREKRKIRGLEVEFSEIRGETNAFYNIIFHNVIS